MSPTSSLTLPYLTLLQAVLTHVQSEARAQQKRLKDLERGDRNTADSATQRTNLL